MSKLLKRITQQLLVGKKRMMLDVGRVMKMKCAYIFNNLYKYRYTYVIGSSLKEIPTCQGRNKYLTKY